MWETHPPASTRECQECAGLPSAAHYIGDLPRIVPCAIRSSTLSHREERSTLRTMTLISLFSLPRGLSAPHDQHLTVERQRRLSAPHILIINLNLEPRASLPDTRRRCCVHERDMTTWRCTWEAGGEGIYQGGVPP